MATEPSPTKRCGPRSRGSNPTCAGPCLYRNRCQNSARAEVLERGNVARAVQQWAVATRPGSDTPGGGTFRPSRCASVPECPKHRGSPPGTSHRRECGYRLWTDAGCLVLSPGENGSAAVPVKSHGVPARGRVRFAYKSKTKWRADAPGRGRPPRSPPLQGWQQIRSRPNGLKGETAESGERRLVTRGQLAPWLRPQNGRPSLFRETQGGTTSPEAKKHPQMDQPVGRRGCNTFEGQHA